MRMVGFLVLLVGLVTSFLPLTSSWAEAGYEESLKQMADGVTEGAVKAKKQRLAVLDFTDPTGNRLRSDNSLPRNLGRKSWWPAN